MSRSSSPYCGQQKCEGGRVKSMHAFDFCQPESLPDALKLLKEMPKAHIIAGGTDLMVLIKDLLLKPSLLISLAKLSDLVGIRTRKEGWAIGPMTPLWHLERSDSLRLTYPALHEAIRALAVPPIRNQATLGGNICLDTKCIYYNQSHVWERNLPRCLKAGGTLCHVAPGRKRCMGALTAETVGPLWIYGAELTLTSGRGKRRMPLKAFYRGDGLNPHDLTAGEVVTSVVLPPPGNRFGAAYYRFAYRKALEFSQFNLSASIRLDDLGRIDSANLVVGAIGPKPVELTESLSFLVGQTPSAALWEEAAKRAGEAVARMARSPRLTGYIRAIFPVYAERLLSEAFTRAKSNGR
jgi:4-hydroxybenzoyl-CoA reductase subunit beta